MSNAQPSSAATDGDEIALAFMEGQDCTLKKCWRIIYEFSLFNLCPLFSYKFGPFVICLCTWTLTRFKLYLSGFLLLEKGFWHLMIKLGFFQMSVIYYT